jgi:hypothetical protein
MNTCRPDSLVLDCQGRNVGRRSRLHVFAVADGVAKLLADDVDNAFVHPNAFRGQLARKYWTGTRALAPESD